MFSKRWWCSYIYNRNSRCALCSIYYTTMRGDSLYGFCFENVYIHEEDDENDDGDDEDNDVVVINTCSMRISEGVRYAYHF